MEGRSRGRVGVPLLLSVLALSVANGAGCAAPTASGAERVLSLGSEQALGPPLIFAHQGYQHLARVLIPPGEHRLRRLRVLPAAAGALVVELYGENELQTPTDRLFEATLEVSPAEVGHGPQGPWSLLALPDVATPAGAAAIWVGFRKKTGEPALWSSPAARQAAYLRSVDPSDPLELLPLKHGAVFALEISP